MQPTLIPLPHNDKLIVVAGLSKNTVQYHLSCGRLLYMTKELYHDDVDLELSGTWKIIGRTDELTAVQIMQNDVIQEDNQVLKIFTEGKMRKHFIDKWDSLKHSLSINETDYCNILIKKI